MAIVAKALPLARRLCQLRIPSFSIRPFSSTQYASDTPKKTNRQIERQLFDARPSQAAGNVSPLSEITKMMQGDKHDTGSANRDYSRMAERLESQLLKNPYTDRAPVHHLHIYAHKHNTLMTLTRSNGNPLLSISCGQLGFRKAGRSGYDPAYQLASHVFGKIQEKGFLMDIKRLELVFRGFGPGREAVTKVLLGNEGRNIRGLVCRVTDSTRIKFGGTRSRKVRRLG